MSSLFLQARSRNAKIQSPRAGSDTLEMGQTEGFPELGRGS